MFVIPWTGNFCTEPSSGVNWYLPPKGINTVLFPIEASNISAKPIWLATFASCNTVFKSEFTASNGCSSYSFSQTSTIWCWRTPFVSKKARDISTIVSPRHFMTKRFVSVTSATLIASKFSLYASSLNFSKSLASIHTAIRSCDSLIANSVPSKPWYLTGTASKLIFKPSASSPTATLTPPAPKSFAFLINFVQVGFLNKRCNLRSIKAFPFWTSLEHFSKLVSLCSLLEPVAPPIPSRPVAPPIITMISPACGCSRFTCDLGAAPTTAPTSIRFAT